MTKSYVNKKGFFFQENGHKYFLDNVPMTGVTTILGVIAKPMLIQWAANQAVDYIEQKIKDFKGYDEALPLVLSDIYKEARVAHRKKKEDAGTAGTDVHKEIEIIIKNAIENNRGIVEPTKVSQALRLNLQVNHFVTWAIANHVKFLASEEKVFSRELFVAGTIDFICEIDGDAWIGDIKTSSGIYPEHFFQTAGYQKLMEDMVEKDGGMPINIKGHVILNCRKDGTFEEKRSISNEDNRLAFLSALNIYRIKQKVEGNLI